MTNGQILAAHAARLGIPLRTLAQVQATLAACKARAKGKNANLDKTMARLMLNAGRLTDETRSFSFEAFGDTHDSAQGLRRHGGAYKLPDDWFADALGVTFGAAYRDGEATALNPAQETSL